MSASLPEQITAALAEFSSSTRLYALTIGGAQHDLLVEAFAAEDQVHEIGFRDVITVSTDAHIALSTLLDQPATLEVSLADGTRACFRGEISEAAMLGSDGGLTRYRVRLVPWLWRLSQVFNNRVWQDKSVIEIVESVFESYRPGVRWRWTSETTGFMSGTRSRSYCCQYRESDLHFIRRLLTEEGLSWRFEHTDDGETVVLFADISTRDATPADPTSEAGSGIRFHGARAVEQQDSVQSLSSRRSMCASMSTVLSYDYKAKKIVCASSPALLPPGSKLLPLESMDVPGQYAYATAAEARRYADIQMQGREARSQLWEGRSTVRTLRAGTAITILDAPLRQLAGNPAFTVLRVTSVGINNLPSRAQEALTELFGPVVELLQEFIRHTLPDDFALAIAQARETGYANCFEAVLADVTWRPQLPDSAGRTHPRKTAPGSQTAIVVGADGDDVPKGADEVYCDRLGRVRIRFHWQDSGDAACWVRVAQRSAGAGMGSQFLPRIGQEVLVQFLEGDIDRPIIVGALYNGQGAGGVPRTPAGRRDADSDDACFGKARDHSPSAQENTAGGNSPVWHGSSANSAGHRNAGAQWGVRSKEFGGRGYNQLLFDDTDAQGRVQLKSSHAASELNLGHLIHSADNYRGSFRGTGAELRTDAYGSIRAGAGLLITSYKISHNAAGRDPVGDNGAGIALLKQAVKLAETFSAGAVTHKTLAFAATSGVSQAKKSTLADNAAPLPAMLAALSGMVAGDSLAGAKADASQKNTAPAKGCVPHGTDSLISIAAKAGLGVSAGQSLQLANGETIVLMSGQDSQFISGGQAHMHSGRAIGILGGLVAAGESGIGLEMVAATDAITVQAQADDMKVQARDDVNVISANSHIDWAAAQKISLSTAGGANITIEGGNITIQCPGKIMVHAGKKSFFGPDRLSYSMPALPRSICVACLKKSLEAAPAFTMVE